MLISTIISLTAETKSPILGPLGRPAQAWLLRQITQKDPAFAKKLHDSQGLKPYTASNLLDRNGRPISAGQWLEPGQTYWLRITSFEKNLSELLVEKVLPNLPKRVSIYKMNLRIDGYTFDPHEHPWAGRTTYSDIAQDSAYVKSKNSVRLEYRSPTAFRSSGEDIPLPIPEQVFRSYWQKWNAFAPAPMEIQELWSSFVKDCIIVSELTNINTLKWQFSKENKRAYLGFTGTTSFELLPAKRRKKWAEFHEGAAAVMQSLAAFAFYCGTGHHTTIGMGQTRLLR